MSSGIFKVIASFQNAEGDPFFDDPVTGRPKGLTKSFGPFQVQDR